MFYLTLPGVFGHNKLWAAGIHKELLEEVAQHDSASPVPEAPYLADGLGRGFRLVRYSDAPTSSALALAGSDELRIKRVVF